MRTVFFFILKSKSVKEAIRLFNRSVLLSDVHFLQGFCGCCTQAGLVLRDPGRRVQACGALAVEEGMDSRTIQE